MDRDQLLKSIRPKITIQELQPLDGFQFVIRQILKLQNDVLLSYIVVYLAEKNATFSNAEHSLKINILSNTLKKDIALKKVILGMVIGLLTKQELAFYQLQKQEINKRIWEFVFKRVSTQL